MPDRRHPILKRWELAMRAKEQYGYPYVIARPGERLTIRDSNDAQVFVLDAADDDHWLAEPVRRTDV